MSDTGSLTFHTKYHLIKHLAFKYHQAKIKIKPGQKWVENKSKLIPHHRYKLCVTMTDILELIKHTLNYFFKNEQSLRLQMTQGITKRSQSSVTLTTIARNRLNHSITPHTYSIGLSVNEMFEL